MKKISFLYFTLIIFFCSCIQATKPVALIDQNLDAYQKAYFASGCFWCVEAIFEHVKGVQEVHSGYAGGEKENPSYNEVSRGNTKHAEAVIIYYDSTIVSFESLLTVFFGSHDPTTLNRQGPDQGPQYRSIAFYSNKIEKTLINEYKLILKKERVFENEIVTETKQIDKFYLAEDYHQNFEKHNPNHPYIKAVSRPRLNSFLEKYPQLLK